MWYPTDMDDDTGPLKKLLDTLRDQVDEEALGIEHRLNTMPRRSLHWSTAHHVYTAAVAMTG